MALPALQKCSRSFGSDRLSTNFSCSLHFMCTFMLQLMYGTRRTFIVSFCCTNSCETDAVRELSPYSHSFYFSSSLEFWSDADLKSNASQVKLAVSLHAANDRERSALLPVNQRFPLSELMDSCREYVDASGRRMTFEWALIQGKNDSPEVCTQLPIRSCYSGGVRWKNVEPLGSYVFLGPL